MQNSNSKDGTNVPTSTNIDWTTSSQTIAKPNVICSQSTTHKIDYDKYEETLKNMSYNILESLNGLSVDQAKRVLQIAIGDLDISSTVDLKPITH